MAREKGKPHFAKAARGRLIVFEGIDGSGKTLQSKLLLQYLRKNKIPCDYVSFPRYDKPWGKMVRRFLSGDFGSLEQVDPYFVSMLYAGDRMSFADTLTKWLEKGKVVVCNRYIGSSIAHMAAKFKKPIDRKTYIDWLENLEYGENKIPKEDLVIFLQVPAKKTKGLMKGRVLDIHEKDSKYLEEVYWVYDYVAGRKKNWVKVDCVKEGKLRNPQEIHEEILEIFGL